MKKLRREAETLPSVRPVRKQYTAVYHAFTLWYTVIIKRYIWGYIRRSMGL